MSYRVRVTTDEQELYAFLRRDPVHAAYAIGDLEPALFAQCTWYLAEDRDGPAALALFYWGLEPAVLLTLGASDGVETIFRHAPLPGHVYMAAQVAHLPVFQRCYDFSADRIRPMLRMAVTPQSFQPARPVQGDVYPFATLCRLGPMDLEDVRALYALGGAHAPDAFSPFQIWDGFFFGVRLVSNLPRNLSLVAVAGTHLVAPTWRVAAVGNVYTHPGYRGRGYGQATSSAVTGELLQHGFQVVLNVEKHNSAAIRVYRNLGYSVHGPYFEGIGVRRNP